VALRGRRRRTADDGLIDIAEARAVCAEQCQGLSGAFQVSVADFNDERVIRKTLRTAGDTRRLFVRWKEKGIAGAPRRVCSRREEHRKPARTARSSAEAVPRIDR